MSKKLIEVSIPLEAINVASAREKSIRRGHPSTLHLWWARRPLAACRAVLFAQLVDDPSAWPGRYPFPEVANTEDGERKRLHRIIERMVPWEALNDERILTEARWEIARSVAWGLGEEPPPPGDGPKILDYLQTKAPPVYDPFCGGGSIPLEAQRLGLRAYGSDLNPVAVLISKALVEIPPKFAGLPPVNPDAQAALKAGGTWNGKGAQGLAEDAGGAGAVAYADAVATYLAFSVTNVSDRNASIVGWASNREHARNVFARQALSMVWDFCESNVFSESSGNFFGGIEKLQRALVELGFGCEGVVKEQAAQTNSFRDQPVIISTDPPYYDNIGYAVLSDFFYVWLKRSLSGVWPDLFRRLTTPKDEELVATPYRHGGKEQAEAFFIKGMGEALTVIRKAATDREPLAIYYAFKQAEVAEDGLTSAGWASFLQAIVDAGLAVDGKWPVRTELERRFVGKDSNALASSIVLVCRKRATDATTITRAEFIRTLKREMPDAIDDIRKAGVGPVDMQQSVIGPGMGVFTRYAKVLEDDDSTMTVKTALTLINRVWEEIESELDANFDAETQVALAWFATYGFDIRTSGELIVVANAKNVPLGALFAAGVFKDLHGRACLMPRGELPAGWNPAKDNTVTVWECVQHTARVLAAEDGGAAAAASLVARMGPKAREARLLAERLFLISTQKGWASEALVYNQLAQEWAHLEDVAMGIDALAPPGAPAQGSLALAGGGADDHREGDAPARPGRALSSAPRPHPPLSKPA